MFAYVLKLERWIDANPKWFGVAHRLTACPGMSLTRDGVFRLPSNACRILCPNFVARSAEAFRNDRFYFNGMSDMSFSGSFFLIVQCINLAVL